MSQFNHLHDTADKIMTCSECGKKFSVSVIDESMWGGHDSEIVHCPWCSVNNGEEYGSAMIMVFTRKIE